MNNLALPEVLRDLARDPDRTSHERAALWAGAAALEQAAPPPLPSDPDPKLPGDAADIKAIRESSGCSLHEARRIALRWRLRDGVNAARTAEDLRPVLHTLINEVLR